MIGNGSATNSWKDGQVFAKEGNKSGDSRVHARVCLGSSGVDARAVQGTQSTRAQAATLESPTKKTVEEMKKLRIKENQESTGVQGITTRSDSCSTEITEDVEEQEGEKSDHAATAAVPFPCDLDGDTEGNPYKQSKTDQRAGISLIVAGDDTLILKKNVMPGTSNRHAGNGSDGELTMVAESATR